MSESDVREARRARRQRSDGQRSREAILRQAGQLATVEGLSGLSIGRLADAVGMSKSGLFAHFGSKQELQLATMEFASDLFAELVVVPATAAGSGLERLRILLESFLVHVEGNVYPGGCFFASVAAEVDTQPGPVRDRANQLTQGWYALLEQAIRDAQAEGDLDLAEEPEQLVFELNGFLMMANAQFVVRQESLPIERARRAIARRLALAAPPPA